jgi:hypothetical protein
MKTDSSLDERERAVALCLELGLPVSSVQAALAQLHAALAQEFALSRAPAVARALAWADAASAAADQMSRVLHDGRARVLGESVATRRLELGTILRCASALSAGEAAGRATFSVENAEPVWVIGDGPQLVQAFARLLARLTASLPDGPHRFELRASQNGRVHVEIQAMPALGVNGLVALVPPPDRPSLALGLQRARRVISEHGGTLELGRESELPRASVTLPRAREERR